MTARAYAEGIHSVRTKRIWQNLNGILYPPSPKPECNGSRAADSRIELSVFEEPLRVELNAPGLRTIKFNGFIIPSVVVYGEAQRLRCHLDRRPCSGIHGSNLHTLGKFSHNLLQSNVIIHLHEIMMMEV